MIIPASGVDAAKALLRECEAVEPRSQDLHRFIGSLRKAMGMPSNNDMRKR